MKIARTTYASKVQKPRFEQYVGRGSERGNKHIGGGMPQIKLIFFNVLF